MPASHCVVASGATVNFNRHRPNDKANSGEIKIRWLAISIWKDFLTLAGLGCITMRMTSNPEKRDKMVSIRLTETELATLESVIELALQRGHYIRKSDVLREILGVVDTGLINESNRAILRGTTGR
jgi:hypothetical protein